MNEYNLNDGTLIARLNISGQDTLLISTGLLHVTFNTDLFYFTIENRKIYLRLRLNNEMNQLSLLLTQQEYEEITSTLQLNKLKAVEDDHSYKPSIHLATI